MSSVTITNGSDTDVIVTVNRNQPQTIGTGMTPLVLTGLAVSDNIYIKTTNSSFMLLLPALLAANKTQLLIVQSITEKYYISAGEKYELSASYGNNFMVILPRPITVLTNDSSSTLSKTNYSIYIGNYTPIGLIRADWILIGIVGIFIILMIVIVIVIMAVLYFKKKAMKNK